MKYKTIAFEGGEACGKTSILNLLKKDIALLEDNEKIVFLREPGATTIGEQIREVILNKDNFMMTANCEALLFAAARAQNYEENIKPLLKQGKTIIFDRFIESSYIYQGMSRGIPEEDITAINDFTLKGWRPDITIFLDISPEAAIERLNADPSREVNRLDLESMEFMHKVRNAYLERAGKPNSRYIILDASLSLNNVYENVKTVLEI